MSGGRRWLAGLACVVMMLTRAEGEVTFDLSQGEEVSPPPAPTAPTAAPAQEASVFQMEVIRPPQQMRQGRILIYHTHTWEAYQQVPEDRYQETEKWRTKDEGYNVVAVGAALCASLEAMGYTVVHDTTAFEPPRLEDAYARSLTMLENRLAAGETYDLYIDLHRDAIASTSTIRRTVSIGGEEVARFMVLVGKGTTGGYQEKPDFAANQAIADKLTAHLEEQCEGLSRDVKVRTGRFNQHIAPCCILIECGTNENTLAQVLCGVPYLAQAISDTMEEMQLEKAAAEGNPEEMEETTTGE